MGLPRSHQKEYKSWNSIGSKLFGKVVARATNYYVRVNNIWRNYIKIKKKGGMEIASPRHYVGSRLGLFKLDRLIMWGGDTLVS